jgi:hypothetical protein
MYRGFAHKSMYAAVMTIVLVASLVAGCGLLDADRLVIDAVWLPDGSIYYRFMGDEGDNGFARLGPSGNVTDIRLTGADQIVGSGCAADGFQTFFVAPDGGLGLEFDCPGETRFLERSEEGGIRLVGSLPPGWGNLAATSGGSLSGIAMKSTPSVASRSGGLCEGIRPVHDGRLGKTFAEIDRDRQIYYLAPPDTTECFATSGAQGVRAPAARRDGSYFAFVMSEPGPDNGNDSAPSSETDYIWWWPTGAATPIRVGPPLGDVGDMTVDPHGPRVALSFDSDPGRGVALLDLRSGKLQTIVRGGADLVRFSPDGKTVMYVASDSSDKLLFHQLQP